MPEKKIVSIEDRIPKLKEARKKKANRRLIFYLTIFFILVSIIVYLQSPLSNVKNIKVKGNSMVQNEEIVNTSGVTIEDNIWGIDFEKVEKEIKSIPEVKTVEVTRKLPNTINIEVEEYVRVGYVKEKDSFYPVLENGQAIKDQAIKIPQGDAPILFGFEDSTYLSEMTKELRKLNVGVSSLISEIHWIPEGSNPYKLKLFMVNGREVFTSIRNFSDKMRAYPSIAIQIEDKEAGYINLDLGTYFVPYDHEDSVTDVEGENSNEGDR